jgi:hypothetical protein
MPQVGFEPTIPVFARAKTVHALDRAAAVIGCYAFSINTLRTGNLNHPAAGVLKPTNLTCALFTLKINIKSPN